MGFPDTKSVKQYVFSLIDKESMPREAKLIVIDGAILCEHKKSNNVKQYKDSIITTAQLIVSVIENLVQLFPEAKHIVLCWDILSKHKLKELKHKKKGIPENTPYDPKQLAYDLKYGFFPEKWTTLKYCPEVRFLIYQRVLLKVSELIVSSLILPKNIEYVIDNFGYIDPKTKETKYLAWHYLNGAESTGEASEIPDGEHAMLYYARKVYFEMPVVFYTIDTDIIPILLLDTYVYYGNTCFYVLSLVPCRRKDRPNANLECYSIRDLYDAIGYDRIPLFILAASLKGNDTINGILSGVGLQVALDAFHFFEKFGLCDCTHIHRFEETGRSYRFEVYTEPLKAFITLIYKMRYQTNIKKPNKNAIITFNLNNKYSTQMLNNIKYQDVKDYLSNKKHKMPGDNNVNDFIRDFCFTMNCWLNLIYINKNEDILYPYCSFTSPLLACLLQP